MDETKDEVASSVSGETVGGETPAEPVEVVREGSNNNNGEDIMVEILRTDVFVDGVRSDDDGGGSVGDKAKPDAEVDGKLEESGVPGADTGVQSLVEEGIVSSESQITILKEVYETKEEVLVVEDTQLLDEETQPTEESLGVAERNEVDGSKNPVVEKGLEHSGERGEDKDEQLVDQSVSAEVEKTRETTVPDEEKSEVKSLNEEDDSKAKVSETRTSDVPEADGEKISVVENVSDEGEVEDTLVAIDAVSIKETLPIAVEGGVETTAMDGSPASMVVTTDTEVAANGGSTEFQGVVSNAVVDANTVNDVEVAGLGDGQEIEAERQIVTDAEVATSDGNEKAVEEEPLIVESATVVSESVTVVSEVVETVEQDVSDPNVEIPHSSKVEDTVKVDMVGEETQIDAEMIEADGEAVIESRDVGDKEANTDTEMTDVKEVDGVETDGEKNTKQSKIEDRARYLLPPEEEGDGEGKFYVLDLVWGKVRSHPWWPGQIFDPSDASEKAVKYQKKDSFLVAYFGDRTFAWNESHLLKPFRAHFSAAEKQGNSESFHNAVECALEEVSRRVELGLSCSCTPKETIEQIKFQVIENAGIREESSKRDGAGEFENGNCFEPERFLEYMKGLALFPCGGAVRLELVIAKAQLLSFYRLKGYSSLPEFVFTEAFPEEAENVQHEEANTVGSMSVDEEDEGSSEQEGTKPQKRSSLKRKHNLRESMYPFKKGRSITELMSEEDRRKSTSVAKVTSNNATPPPPMVPKPSFKIGECIKRIASQLTSGSSILKSKSELDPSPSTEDAGVASSGYSSMEDLLSQLQVAAQEPMKEHSFSDVIACFFSDFRNSVVVDQNPDLHKPDGGGGGGRRKRLAHLDGSSEAFEFDDVNNDSYWTDRVIENGDDEDPHSDGGARRIENQHAAIESKPQKTGRRPYRRRLQETIHELPPQKPPGYIDANAPAELVMMFPEIACLPSEAYLSRMFKRFGPIRESETVVDREGSRARVVFKKCCDAEVASNSAGRFNIFGPVHVTYQLNYSVSDIFRSSGLAMMEVAEDEDIRRT